METPQFFRKIFCWFLALILLAGAIAVAVLIGGKQRKGQTGAYRAGRVIGGKNSPLRV